MQIRRSHVLEDSIAQLEEHRSEVRKRLRIEFTGEQGVDFGGLIKVQSLCLSVCT